MSHFLNFTLSPPFCYSLKITNYRMREKVREIVPLETIAILGTHLCINNPSWKSSGIAITLSKHYIVISRYVFLVAHCNIIRASKIPRWESKKKKLSYRNRYVEGFVWRASPFSLHALLLMSVFIHFRLFPPWKNNLLKKSIYGFEFCKNI